jgi:hypothetical protein
MVSKAHISIISILTVAAILVSLPTGIINIYNFAIGNSNVNALNSMSLVNSALLKCTFYEYLYAVYSDNTSQLVGTNYNYAATPGILNFLQNSANGKTINSFYVKLADTCNSIPSFVTQTTVQGTMQVNAAVTGSDGSQHVLVGGSQINIPSQQVTNNNQIQIWSYNIPAYQILQYNTASGSYPVTLKVFVYPSLTYNSYLNDGTNQKSTWSNWVTQFVTININNPTTSTTSSTSCPQGTVNQNGQCTASITQASSTTPTGTQIAQGNLQFFYRIIFQGDPSVYCGYAQPSPNNVPCVVAPTSGPLNVPFTALNFVGSNRATINSLQSFTIEAIVTPSIATLNLNPQNSIVYTGAITIEGKTVAIPSSAISSDGNSFVSNGVFRFPTATLNPSSIDQLLKQNGIQPATPEAAKVRVFVSGKFTGSGPNGNFQGAITSNPYIDINIYYLANSPNPTSTANDGTAYNPNCNFGTASNGKCNPSPTCNAGMIAIATTSGAWTCIAAPPTTCANGLSGANCAGPPSTNTTSNIPNQCSTGQTQIYLGGQVVCIPTPPTGPTDAPNSPPNPCADSGLCQDPPQNPPTTNPPPTNAVSYLGNIPITAGTGSTSQTQGQSNSTGGPKTLIVCDSTSSNPCGPSIDLGSLGIILLIVLVILIIVIIIIKRRNN